MLSRKDPDILKTYLEDSSNLKGGHAEEVVSPENIEELSLFLKNSNSAKRPVTISGGGTSTTGSRIPFGGAVVSLEKFNRILKISRQSSSAIVQAGVMVDELKKGADREGLFYTCHPTEGTAFVGGTIATNASGSRSFKYGSTRNYVERLKMVLPDGAIMDLARGQVTLSRGSSRISLPGGIEIDVPMPAYRMPEVKNAAGYFMKDGMDLIDLFIGQEGTLSVIVEAEIALMRKPEKILSSFVFFNREEDAWGFAAAARDLSKKNRAAPGISAIDALSIEYFDRNALDLLRSSGTDIPGTPGGAIFFEQETAPGRDEDKTLDEWLGLISRHGSSLDDTWVAMNERDAGRFAMFRHSIPEAINDIVRKNGFQKLSADIAVPDAGFLEMMKFYRDTLNAPVNRIRHVIFGHIGENHVHANVLPGSDAELRAAGELIMRFVKKGVSLGGTVSAEHGIGKIKHKYLQEMYGASGVLEMSKIKRVFDPNCILSLDNIFPRELLNYQKK